MFEKTDAQDVIWRSQQTEHGQALVKSWKLLTSCGVYIITFTTTMFALLVEKKYPLSRFTLEQLVNVARLQEEDEENKDADIEEDDDAEIIFPYEVHGDQTPPRDESSDSGSEPEAEEADDEPEAEDANDELEVEEAETGRTEVALLGSEAKIRKMEREILHHDLSSVEETLGKVVERLKVLENKENATLRKKLAEKEGFYLEMVRKGAVPKPPSDDEGPERPRKTSKKSDGDEGPSDPRGSLK
nr:hypothetical protein [Tanacetum cinerariifolium]